MIKTSEQFQSEQNLLAQYGVLVNSVLLERSRAFGTAVSYVILYNTLSDHSARSMDVHHCKALYFMKRRILGGICVASIKIYRLSSAAISMYG